MKRRNAASHLALALGAALALGGCASQPSPGAASAASGAAGAAAPAELGCRLSSNCVNSLDGGLPALAYAGTPAQALAALKATLAGYPEATLVTASDAQLVVIFTTPIGFRDQVIFQIDARRQRIDFRSQSTLGLYDFGKNRSRMRDFSARFAATAAP